MNTPHTTAIFEKQDRAALTNQDRWEEMTEHARALERENIALRKDAARLRWLHTGGSSGARKEWGVAEIEFDANGQVIGALWGLSDSSDIDKAMEAEFADENPALAMNRPETYGLPE